MSKELSINIIKDWCKFGKNKCYILSIISRKKNNTNITHSQEIVRRFVLLNDTDIEPSYDSLKSYALKDTNHDYYMYLTVNPRHTKVALKNFIKELVEMLFKLDNDECTIRRLNNIHGMWYSILESNNCRNKDDGVHFLIDVDDKTIINDILTTLTHMENLPNYKNFKIEKYVETKNGYHIITTPFESDIFVKLCSEIPIIKNILSIKTEKKVKLKELVSINKDGLLFIENLSTQS
jgi:hypothetical protein